MLIAWSMLQMKGYGQVALRAVADSLDFLVDMKVYFAVLDDSMFAVGQEIYHLMFDNTDDLLLASTDEKMLWKFIEMLCKYENRVEYTTIRRWSIFVMEILQWRSKMGIC